MQVECRGKVRLLWNVVLLQFFLWEKDSSFWWDFCVSISLQVEQVAENPSKCFSWVKTAKEPSKLYSQLSIWLMGTRDFQDEIRRIYISIFASGNSTVEVSSDEIKCLFLDLPV